jgi:hypothetical protein
MDVFADDIPAMCAEATSFEEAVWIACESRRRSGKMHSHQTKVPKDARREFGYRIIRGFFDLSLTDFDQFHDFLWDIKPIGIGPLTTYDVAIRVGAFLNLEPDAIYLHTGARLGWEALLGYRVMGPPPGAPYRAPRSTWPVPLRALSADMAEDFLCTYREVLGGIQRDATGRPI